MTMNLCTLGLSECTCTSGFGETTNSPLRGQKDQKSPSDRETLRNGIRSTCSPLVVVPLFLRRSQTTRGTPFLLIITLPPTWTRGRQKPCGELPSLRLNKTVIKGDGSHTLFSFGCSTTTNSVSNIAHFMVKCRISHISYGLGHMPDSTRLQVYTASNTSLTAHYTHVHCKLVHICHSASLLVIGNQNFHVQISVQEGSTHR